MVATHKQHVIRRRSMDKHDVNSDRNRSCGQFEAAGGDQKKTWIVLDEKLQPSTRLRRTPVTFNFLCFARQILIFLKR